jgi:hypothetical protein
MILKTADKVTNTRLLNKQKSDRKLKEDRKKQRVRGNINK